MSNSFAGIRETKGFNAAFHYIKDVTDELFVGVQHIGEEEQYEVMLRRRVVSALVPSPTHRDAVGYIITAQMARTYLEAVEMSDEMARKVAAGIVLGQTLAEIFAK